MELWIRSQDKEQLIKVDNLNVFHNTVNCETINFIIKNNFDDLGSYATDYDGDDPELIKLYDYRYNAMYTYYDSLIPETSGLENAKIEPLNYETLKALYDDKKITNVFDSDLVCAKVESGLEANLVTFRFWIEGFDADYFIGIPSSTTDIKVNLSFKVDTKDKLN